MAGTLGGKGGRAPIVGINVTPMVDVVLVLLVIMMVSATYIVAKSMKVELPKASSQSDQVPMTAAVTVTKDGKYFFNQEPATDSELITKYRAVASQNPDISLVVSADKQAVWERVTHAIDLARDNGIVKVAINVESAEKKAQ